MVRLIINFVLYRFDVLKNMENNKKIYIVIRENLTLKFKKVEIAFQLYHSHRYVLHIFDRSISVYINEDCGKDKGLPQ